MSNGAITKINFKDSVVHKITFTQVALINVLMGLRQLVYVLREFIRNHKLYSLIRSEAFSFILNGITGQTFQSI